MTTSNIEPREVGTCALLESTRDGTHRLEFTAAEALALLEILQNPITLHLEGD